MTFKHEPRTAEDTWILVADRGRARVYCQTPEEPDELRVVHSLNCPDAEIPPHELVSDKPGYYKGHSGSLNRGDPEIDFKHRTALRFAKDIVDRLDDGRQQNCFGHLTVVAPPLFLGVLRTQMAQPLSRLVNRTIDRDYTSLPVSEIAARLRLDD